MVPARVSQNVNPGCEQAQADHDGGENAASDAEPTKPPARRRGYQPETSDWGGSGRHALYMFLRNTVPSVEPVTDRRLAAAERAARTSGRPGPRRDAEPRLQNSRLI